MVLPLVLLLVSLLELGFTGYVSRKVGLSKMGKYILVYEDGARVEIESPTYCEAITKAYEIATIRYNQVVDNPSAVDVETWIFDNCVLHPVYNS